MQSAPCNMRHKIINDSLMFFKLIYESVIKCKLKFPNFNIICECFMGHIEQSNLQPYAAGGFILNRYV